MPNQLTGMRITGVHLVGSPAIKEPYLIVKSSEGGRNVEKEEEIAKAKKTAAADAEDQLDNGADESTEDANGKKMKKSEESDGSGAADKADDSELKKAQEEKATAEASLKAKDASLMKSALDILKNSDSEAAKAAVEALETELGEKKVEKSNKGTTEEVTNIVKSMLPDLVKAVEEPLKKSLDDAKVELEEIKKSNALLIGERTEREIQEIVKSLVGDHEKNTEYVRLMKSQLSEEAFKAFVAREQENAQTVRKSSAFKEVGGSGWESSSGNSPYQQLTDIANGLIQKSSEKMPFNDAFAKAVAERPDLWDEYRNDSYANKARED